MKKTLSKLKPLLILIAFASPVRSMAQTDIGGLFKSAPADATKLIDAYMTPMYKGLGVGLNSGWHNTAKAKNFLRFDLRITGTLAFIPDEDKTYNTTTLGLQNIKPAAGSNGIGQTFFGPKGTGAEMELYANGAATGQKFKLPGSTADLGYTPSAQIQLTVGLPKNIDVSLRLVPNVKLGDFGKLNIFGAGAKVEILPLIMGKTEKLVPVDVAIAAGFTTTTYTKALDVNNGKYQGQELEAKLKGFSLEAIASRKITFFTPFVSVGYVSSNSTLNAFGTYDFQTAGGSATFTNPISIKHDDISAMKGSVGFQMNLAFLRVYASYTQSKYGYFNGGLGFGIGK